MYIEDKIEEIRRKPEHIRLRYVYFFVAFFMFLIFVIWIFSFTQQSDKENRSSVPIIPEKLKEQNNDLMDSVGNLKNNLDEANNSLKNITPESTNPRPSLNPDAPINNQNIK